MAYQEFQNEQFEIDLSLEDCTLDTKTSERNAYFAPKRALEQKNHPFIKALEADAMKLPRPETLTGKALIERNRKMEIIKYQIIGWAVNHGFTYYGRDWSFETHCLQS